LGAGEQIIDRTNARKMCGDVAADGRWVDRSVQAIVLVLNHRLAVSIDGDSWGSGAATAMPPKQQTPTLTRANVMDKDAVVACAVAEARFVPKIETIAPGAISPDTKLAPLVTAVIV
jgi:hypothetical protein